MQTISSKIKCVYISMNQLSRVELRDASLLSILKYSDQNKLSVLYSIYLTLPFWCRDQNIYSYI